MSVGGFVIDFVIKESVEKKGKGTKMRERN